VYSKFLGISAGRKGSLREELFDLPGELTSTANFLAL
jgi:hypothetical protein